MVVASMQAPYDRFAKAMVRAAFEPLGVVQTEAQVSREPQWIDLRFIPALVRRSTPEHLGLLGRIADGASTLEFFHDTPSGETLADCLIKHGAFRHSLSLRETEAATPIQWVISSGRPNTGIDGLWLRRIPGSLPGLYEAPPLLWTRLVVVNELPVARDTLLVRLLGAGAVLRRAIAELNALQEHEPERTLARHLLVGLRLAVPTDPTKQSKEQKEFLMDTQELVEAFRREAVQEGVVQGRAEGVVQGRAEGAAHSLVAVYEARFGAMPKDLRTIVEHTHDDAMLLTWLQFASTHSANEVAAAIRSSSSR